MSYLVGIANSIETPFVTEAEADNFILKVQALLGSSTPIRKIELIPLFDAAGMQKSSISTVKAEWPKGKL